LDGALKDPFSKILMGVTAENLCDRHGLTREMQDALAVESHRRAAAPANAFNASCMASSNPLRLLTDVP
jgi:acetyl-CoA C-acetyltransferase